jgi:insertion element IS1 protein InsB
MISTSKSVMRAAPFSCYDSKQRTMKCGVSSFPRGISNGSGLRLMAPRNRSLPFMSVIVRHPSARQLWRRIPQVYRAHATFYADGLAAYKTVLPSERRQVCAKSSGHTNMIERFNCTLKRRISRLMRGALSFSRRSKTISERSSTSSVIITRLLSGLLSHLTFVALPFV